MFYNIEIRRKLTSLLLLVALTVPSAFQLFHIYTGHEHVVCVDTQDHFHEASTSCDICDFHHSPFHFETTENVEKKPLVTFTIHKTSLPETLYFTTNYTPTQLRAPPAYS